MNTAPPAPAPAAGRRLVALRLPPGPGFLAALDRAWAAGDAVLPLPVAAPPRQLRRLLERLRPAALVDQDTTASLPGGEPVAPATALVVVTSGSTGEPKAVELPASALSASARAGLARIGAGSGARWLCCLPVHHVAGLLVLLRAQLCGTTPVIHPRFDPAAVAAQPGVTHVSLVPTMLARLLDARVDLRRFETILLGGAPATRPLLQRAAGAGARVVTTYGMTETCGGCVYDGAPLDGVDVALEADGRIRVRGPVLCSGYRGRPDLTAAALQDGWLRTNDLGRWGAGGRLEVLGRRDNVIVTGGEKVAAGEVAALLADHPGVADAAVVGHPDPEWGERVVAVVVASGTPPTLPELRAHVSARTAGYKAPRELVVLAELPRTDAGKIDRAALRRAVTGSGVGRCQEVVER